MSYKLNKKKNNQMFDIYSVNEVLIQTHKYDFSSHKWINKLLSNEYNVPEHCLKLERWQGPPNIIKVEQHELVLSF